MNKLMRKQIREKATSEGDIQYAKKQQVKEIYNMQSTMPGPSCKLTVITPNIGTKRPEQTV